MMRRGAPVVGKDTIPLGDIFRREVRRLAEALAVDDSAPVAFEVLGVEEALGDPAPYRDFALQRGEERLVECRLKIPEGVAKPGCAGEREFRGQCFSSSPSRRTTTLAALLEADSEDSRSMALLIALGNALGVASGRCGATVHCRDGGPQRCAHRMAQEVAARYGSRGLPVGVVGYQPAILGAMTEAFGAGSVRMLDLHPSNVGAMRQGVRIGHGEDDWDDFSRECRLVLITGSTLANGSFPLLRESLVRQDTPIVFFGTTAALGAEVLGVERWCFEAS